MLPSFKQYLVEEQREVFFTYGRMNPPTTGHGKLMNAMSAKSGKSPYKIYLSQTQDARKNPLSYDQKIKHARKMYPKHARSIMSDKGSRTVFDVAVKLYDEGYNKVNMVVGADRLTEFKTLLNKYNNVKGRHGFYNFEKINIISSGDRDPDAEGLEGMSASKQRDNAKQNDFTLFSQGIPTSMSNRDAKKLFNDVRIGMGLKETREFYHKLNLEPVSETREKYIEGELFVEGDKVTVKSGQTGSIHRLGTNYVIVALDEGNVTRQWLEDVELIENSPIVKKGVVITTKKQPEEGTPQAVKKAVKMTPGIDRAQNILSRRRSFKDIEENSVDAEKEYGKSFVASAKSVGVQRKLTKELGVKLKEVEKSLGHGGGGNGLTPDDVKSNPKWKAAKKALDVAFKKEQQMNQAMSKAFGKQMKDFRNKDRRGYMSLFIGESTEACCEGGKHGTGHVINGDPVQK